MGVILYPAPCAPQPSDAAGYWRVVRRGAIQHNIVVEFHVTELWIRCYKSALRRRGTPEQRD